MIDEKKVMEDKVLILSVLAILTGILFGAGACLVIVTVVTKSFPGFGIIGIVFILISVVFSIFADKTQRQIRKFINRPYVGDQKENEVYYVNTFSENK